MNRKIKFRAWDKEKNKMIEDVMVCSTGVYDFGLEWVDSKKFIPMQFKVVKTGIIVMNVAVKDLIKVLTKQQVLLKNW